MKKLLLIGGAVVAILVGVNVFLPHESAIEPAVVEVEPEEVDATERSTVDSIESVDYGYFDTIMAAKGHAFGYAGDISEWDGWYFDSVCVGDDHLLSYDSVGPSLLRLDLVTRKLTVDLGDPHTDLKIQRFMNPINGFKRFQKSESMLVDSFVDDEQNVYKLWGHFSLVIDYADAELENSTVLNQIACRLAWSACKDVDIPAYTALYAGYKQSKSRSRECNDNNGDMSRLYKSLRDEVLDGWREDAGGMYLKSTIDVRAHTLTPEYVTFCKYDYACEGPGHGMYTTDFHTFDLKSGKRLTNNDIFKSRSLDKVAKQLFEVMAGDSHYLEWHEGVKTSADVEASVCGWMGVDQTLSGSGQNQELAFELPGGALTDKGVVFSFYPYQIDCWAAGDYHFVVPYSKLIPYLTPKAKALIGSKS